MALDWVSEKASGILICSGYKAGTLYGLVPDNSYTTGIPKNAFDFTTARNSLGTRTNSAGIIETMANDVGRLQYPSCPSLLLETGRTNLAAWSEDLTQWSALQAGDASLPTVIPATELLFGLPTWDVQFAMNGNVAGNNSALQGAGNIAATGKGVFSFYAKSTQGTQDLLIYLIGNRIAVTIDETAKRYEIPTNWSGTGVYGLQLRGGDMVNVTNERFLITGIQYEDAADYATAYIKTTTASAIRAVDVLPVRTDMQSSGFLSSTAGTMYLEIIANEYVRDLSGERIFNLSNVGLDTIEILRSSDSSTVYTIWPRQSNTIVGGFSLAPITGTLKLCFSFNSTTGMIIYSNGTEVYNEAAFTSVAFTDFLVSAQTLVNPINQMIFFPTSLSASECISLTS